MAATAPRPAWLAKSLRGVEILGVVFVLAALMLWLGGAFRGDLVPSGTLPAPPPQEPAKTAPATEVLAPLSETFEGSVRSGRTTVIAARAAGPVRTLVPKVGDTVLTTEPFGTLDPTIYEAKVAVQAAALDAARLAFETAGTRLTLAEQNEKAAAAELELARKEHARATKLSTEGSGTASELDVAVAKLRRAEAAEAEALTTIEAARKSLREGEGQIALREKELALAKTELSFTELRTEVGGVVVRRLAEPGSHAAPGAPLLEVYDPADLRLDVPVRESLVPGLDRQRDYPVRLPAVGRDVSARIVEIVPSAEEGSRSVRVRLALAATPGLVPGMSGSLELPLGTRHVVAVPEAALFHVGQLSFVDVVLDGRRERRFVRTGTRLPEGKIEIQDGLRAGDACVLREEATRGR